MSCGASACCFGTDTARTCRSYATSTSDQIWSVTFGNYVDYTETSVATIGFTGSSKLLLETRTSTLAVLTSAQDVRFTDTSSIVSHVRAIAMAFECQPGCPAPYQVWCQTQECVRHSPRQDRGRPPF